MSPALQADGPLEPVAMPDVLLDDADHGDIVGCEARKAGLALVEYSDGTMGWVPATVVEGY